MSLALLCGTYLVMLILGIAAIRLDTKWQRILLVAEVLIIATLFGTRASDIGHDALAYFEVYWDPEKFRTRFTMEPAFEVLVRFLRIFAPHVQVFIWMLSMITAASLAGACINFVEERKYVNLAYALTYCMQYTVLMQVNVVRQGIASSIMLFGISLIHKKKYVPGILVAVIGCTFHYSAFVILAAFLFFEILQRARVNMLLTVLFMAAGFLIANTNLMGLVIDIIPQNSLTDRLLGYVGENTSGNLYIKFLYYTCFFLFFGVILLWKKQKESNTVYNLLMGILSASALISFNALAAGRMIIVIDYLIPALLFQPEIRQVIGQKLAGRWKNIKNIYLVLVTVVCILAFIASLFTYSMRSNLKY